MRFNSLFVRTAAALFLGVLAMGALMMAVGWYWVCKPLVQHSARNLATQIQNAAETFQSLPPDARVAFRQRLQQAHDLTLEPTVGATPGTPVHLPYLLHLNEALGQLAGKPVALMQQNGHYVVDFPGQTTPLRFRFSHDKIGTHLEAALATLIALALMVSLLVALALAKRMARPIELIAQQTDRASPSQPVTLLPEDGPDELRDIARHFNHMSVQNRELLDNRATMLAGISHDLRAPITRARMALELARATMDDNLALRIERALFQMEALITQYLEYSADSAKEPATPQNVAALLDEIIQPLNLIDLHIEVPDVSINLPVRAFSRCAQNLLDNAIRHGASPISVRFQQIESTWVLDIADSGQGIPDNQLDQVFQPFHRLDNARTHPGSGLGLAIVQEICRLQGWFVSLLPRPGGGLIARLSLPLAAQDQDHD